MEEGRSAQGLLKWFEGESVEVVVERGQVGRSKRLLEDTIDRKDPRVLI